MLDYYKKQGTIWQGKNQKGKVFSIFGDVTELPNYVARMMRKSEEAPEVIAEKKKIIAELKAAAEAENKPFNIDDIDWDEHDIYDDDENSLQYSQKDTDGSHFTQEERDADLADLQAIVDDINANGWMPQFLKMPRKKDGSLAKGRVTRLWRGETFQRYWEDSYGFNAPELSIKSLDDYSAVLEFTNRTVGY
jgi:hypothetical protein